MCKQLFLAVAILLFFAARPVQAEELEVSAIATTNPVALTIRIQGYNITQPVTLYRRVASGGYASWTNALSTNIPAPAGIATYTDTTVVAGTVYEYRADRNDASASGYGVGSVDAPAGEARGRILLVIEDGLLAPLSNDLNRLELDLIGDGWRVLRTSVARYNPALTNAARLAQLATVRNAISNAYNSAGSLVAVYLIGHVPVPYSIASQSPPYYAYPPDGHEEHIGCWPTDQYYADIAGAAWKDTTYTWSNSWNARCSTYPGDGKFDEFSAPSDLELQVGRVDLADMPVYGASETELMRRYLDKIHRFRLGLLPMSRRGGVTDDLPPVRRTAPSWFGPAGYNTTNMLQAFQNTNGFYLTSANGAGSFSSVGTHYSSSALVTNDPRVFLQLALGSYFGDWDSTNNLLRANLGGLNGGMASLWFLFFADTHGVSLPHVDIAWSLNHMALGETLGYGVRFTQNQGFAGGARQSIVYSLLGDPSLRLFPLAPPTRASAANQGSNVALTWDASTDESLLGYYVYQSTNGLTGTFTRITSDPIDGTGYTHTNALSGTRVYQIRAVKREATGSGTYFNTSQGSFALASSDAKPMVTLALNPETASEEGDGATFTFERTGAVTSDLVVAYAVSGSADSSDVLEPLPGTITIPTGSTRAELALTIKDDQLLEGTEELILTVQTNASVGAGLFIRQKLTILDNESMPAAPTNVTAAVEDNAVRINWTDASSNETRFIVERRDLAAGGTLILDNDNTNFVVAAPTNAPWLLQVFTNAYGGTCRSMKQANTATNYMDFRPGLKTPGEFDLDIWYPSGSVGGSYVVAQTALVVHAAGTNSVVFTPRTGGGGWQPLGRFTLGTNAVIRMQSASSGSEYSIADALRLVAPFVVVTQIAANATSWLDTAVSSPGAYEYQVRSGLENTSSVPSARAAVGLGGGLSNRPPFVRAGTNLFGYLPLTNILTGSASDPDDGPAPVTAWWRQISGPALATIADTNAYNTSVTFPTSGVYIFGFEASDGATSALETVTHTVMPQLIPGDSTNGTEFAVDADTLGLWHFNGNGNDASGNGFHLTLSNGCAIVTGGTATAWMAAPSGAALRIENYPHTASAYFPDWRIFNNTNGSRTPLTLEARIFLNSWGSNLTYKMIGLDQNSDTHFSFLQVNAGSTYGLIQCNSAYQLLSETESGALINTGVWHHLMMTFDGTNRYQVILDGVPAGAAVTNAPNWTRTNDVLLILGNFPGYIDEVRLSKVVRYVAPVANTNPPTGVVASGSSGIAGGSSFGLAFGTATDQLYAVDYVESLGTNVWLILSNNIPGTGAELLIQDSLLATNRYYRIRTWRP